MMTERKLAHAKRMLAHLASTVPWEIIESGWHTSALGGICRERGGWYFHPTEGERRGPFKTAEAAKRAAPIAD